MAENFNRFLDTQNTSKKNKCKKKKNIMKDLKVHAAL